MKKTDIALIILIAAISILLSFWIFSMILEDPSEKFERLTYVDGITDELSDPDIETFNAYANNPTAEVYMGECDPDEIWDEVAMRCMPKGSDSPEEPGPEPEPTPEPEPEPENPSGD